MIKNLQLLIKNWAKSHRKELVIAGTFLMIGMIISPRPTKIIEKVSPEVVIKREIEYVDECKEPMSLLKKQASFLKKENNLRRQIMELDNQSLLLSATGHFYCADAFDAISRFDFDEAELIAMKMFPLSSQINDLADKKIDLLKQLEEIK